MSLRRFIPFILLSTMAWAQPLPTGLTPIQAVSLKRVSHPVLSPDGSQILFYRSTPRLAGDAPGSSYSHLFIMPADGKPGSERLLMGGKRRVSGAAFSPDGQWVTFTDQREGAPHREVYGFRLSGGEAVRLTKTPHGVRTYAWHPSGNSIAFTATDPRPKARAAARKMGFRHEVMDEDWSHVSLHHYDLKTSETKQLTSGVTVQDFAWDAEGSKLAVAASPRNTVDDSYMASRLYVRSLSDEKLRPLVNNPGKLGAFAWSPNGKRLAYISAANKRDPHAGMLYVREENGDIRAADDEFEGMFHTVSWRDNRVVQGVLSEGVQTLWYNCSPGWYRQTVGFGVAFRDAVPMPDSRTFFLVGSTAKHPEELFRVQDRRAVIRMTDSNPMLKSTKLGKQTVETITARDGLNIEGMLIHAVGPKQENRPLVIVAHGGPESHYSNGWLTSYSMWGQILAARGYHVWYPNYRASTGRGVKFAMMDHGDPMGSEFEDHLDAIAEFVKRGLVDPKRVGIGGGSYGGYTAAWAATRHSKHFAAAVSFVPFVDIRTKWYTSDISNEFYLVHYEEKWPHEQAGFLMERSPLSYATACKTPLLLLGGTADPRVHPSQPHMLWRAVKMATKTPCRYIRYPGEGHGNRVNTNRYDYLLRTLRWLEHYLQPGDHRNDTPPAFDLDYSEWAATK